MVTLTAFWIAIYCSRVTLCDLYKGDAGEVIQYQTKQACLADNTTHGRVMPRTDCINVNGVVCYKGGSACTFDPADDQADGIYHKMVQMPR